MLKKAIYIYVILLTLKTVAYSLPAFPGAEGMGASTVGGRGGTVYIVDQLEDNAAAEAAGTTLREACEASGPRYVTFAVSGVIWLESRLTINDDYITIAGQTSPGGICIAGYMVQLDGVHDVLITHMRFRTGPLYETASGPSYASVAIMGGSALGGADGKLPAGTDPSYNVVFDHCSFSYAADTNINVGYDYYNIVFSWCYITDPLRAAGHDDGDNHNLGLLFWGKYNSTISLGGATVHHTYFGDNLYRTPSINYYGFLDQTNNVVYHFTNRIASKIEITASGRPTMNMTSNYVDVRHIDNTDKTNTHTCILFPNSLTASEVLYMSSNIQSYLDGSTPQWHCGDYDSNWGADTVSTDWESVAKFSVTDIAVTATVMNSTYASSIVENAGANRIQSTTNFSPDTVDSDAKARFISNTGAYKEASSLTSQGDWPTFSTPTPPTDSNSNGIADDWEVATFGGLVSATDDFFGDGYNNVEYYFHYLTEDIVPSAPTSTTMRTDGGTTFSLTGTTTFQ